MRVTIPDDGSVRCRGRLEGDVHKRDRQIEMLLCAKYSTFTPVVENIRVTHERNLVMQTLYKQVRVAARRGTNT